MSIKRVVPFSNVVRPHTPEPWLTARANHVSVALPTSGEVSLRVVWSDATGSDVAYCMDTDDDNGNANARRIVACVNACAGSSTEELERGVRP